MIERQRGGIVNDKEGAKKSVGGERKTEEKSEKRI